MSSECFSRCRCLHRPLRLLPAGATIAGRDSHPLKNGAFTAHCHGLLGVPQDDAEAVRWFRLSAEQGFVHGQRELGVMYLNGRGVPQDDVTAHMWLNLAGAQGLEEAREVRDW